MAKNHGAKQQKRVAKQKAKRVAKRTLLNQRTSKDPTIRLQHAGSWPIVQAFATSALWDEGIGYLAIARRDPEGRLVFAVFLVDVYCLGVKDAFWQEGSAEQFEKMIGKMEQTQKMRAIAPACLAKIVKGAVEYAQSFGLPPHHDYRHASSLLDGIDPSTCPNSFTFGRDGKPFYIQGPHESVAQAAAIMERIRKAGGHFLVALNPDDEDGFRLIDDELDEVEFLGEDDSSDE